MSTEMFPLSAMTDDEWHVWRQAGIGGSDIAALVGLSNYASPTSLYYEKTGELKPDRVDTERQRIGRRMEQVLAQEFTDRTGLYCIAQQSTRVHSDYPFARCTLDGYASETLDDDHDPALILGTVEFKTDGRFGWPDGVPPNIRAQCIWGMGVTGLSMSWLVVMFAGFRVEVFPIPFDLDAQSDWRFMLDTAQRFWVDHVCAGEPPTPDDHEETRRTLEAIYTPQAGAVLVADDDALRLVDEVRDAAVATKVAEAAEKELRNQLRDLIGDATELIEGWTDDTPPKPITLATWRPQSTRRFDTTGFRKDYPDLAEVYTEETPSRVLRLSKGVK